MADWKYIVIRVGEEGQHQDLPIIFPGYLVHKTVARLMTRAVDHDLRMVQETVSAGFIGSLGVNHVHGESESLDLASRPADASLINCFPHSNGVEGALLMENIVLIRHVELMMKRAKVL